MTTLATTKEFIDTFFINSDKDEYHTDLFQFFQKEIFNVQLVCDFNSADEFVLALSDNPYWELMMDKYDKIIFNPRLDEELTANSFYDNLNEENIFFTSLSIEQCRELQQTRGYIYISSEDISKSWQPIKHIRDHSLLKVTNHPKFPSVLKFDSWDKIDDFLLPLTSLVIFDRYIFSDSGNQRLVDNLFKLLEKVCANVLLRPLNLTIISEFENDNQLISSYNKVEDFFSQKGISNICFNIVKHDKSKYPSDFEGLHSRLILTNNLRFKCEDSFNFFKRNGKVNNDADIHVSLHMCHSRKCFYEKELSDIKRYVSRLHNHPPETLLANKIFYHPNKSNYLFN